MSGGICGVFPASRDKCFAVFAKIVINYVPVTNIVMTDTLDPPEFDEERMLPYSKKLAEGLFLLLDGDAGKMFKFFDMANYLTSEVVEGFYQAMRRQCPASVVDEEILFFLEVCSYVYLHFDK